MASATSVKRHHGRDGPDTPLTDAVAPATMGDVKVTTMGQRVRSARERRGLGVNELNRLVRLQNGKRLSDGYISRVETGEREDIEAEPAVAIARVLGVRAEWLVTGEGPREFSSGEMPAMETAAKRDKPNLERALEASNVRGRWSQHTVDAARALKEDRQLADWPAVLDRLEKAIRKVIADVGH